MTDLMFQISWFRDGFLRGIVTRRKIGKAAVRRNGRSEGLGKGQERTSALKSPALKNPRTWCARSLSIILALRRGLTKGTL